MAISQQTKSTLSHIPKVFDDLLFFLQGAPAFQPIRHPH